MCFGLVSLLSHREGIIWSLSTSSLVLISRNINESGRMCFLVRIWNGFCLPEFRFSFQLESKKVLEQTSTVNFLDVGFMQSEPFLFERFFFVRCTVSALLGLESPSVSKCFVGN